jgi:glycolate oxidase
VITEITLRIHPKPSSTKTCLAFFETIANAGHVIIDAMSSGVIPSVMELLDENTIEVLRQEAKVDFPAAGAMIFAEVDGYTEAETSFQMDRVIQAFKKNHATAIQTARSVKEVEALWKVRKSIGSTAARLRTNNVSEDVTVPVSKVPDLLVGISKIVRNHGFPYVIFGHAGDGNLHPRIMYERSDPDQAKRLSQAVEAIFRLTCQLGGTLSGEHGIGLAKAPYLGFEHSSAEMELMRGIKKLFDPDQILNPGKMGLDP